MLQRPIGTKISNKFSEIKSDLGPQTVTMTTGDTLKSTRCAGATYWLRFIHVSNPR